MLPLLTSCLLFVAFLLLLLVSLSVPIIHTIYLFNIAANFSSSLFQANAAATARFGVWGYCLSAIQVSAIGIDHSTQAQCSAIHLGYDFDDTVTSALHLDTVQNALSRTLTAVLVLHPIACVFAFLALLNSLSLLRNRRSPTRTTFQCSLVAGLIAAILTTIVLLIDVIAIAVVKGKVNDQDDDAVTMSWGNAVWMAVAATITLWLALMITCVGMFRRSRNTDKY